MHPDRPHSAQARAFSARPALLTLSLVLVSSIFSSAQQGTFSNKSVSAEDLEAVIASNRTVDLKRSAEMLRLRLQPLVPDLIFRSSVHKRIPAEFEHLAVHDSTTLELLHAILRPVLSFFGREEAYDILLINSPTPYVMSDSGVLLVISTGLIMRARSDDELLGYTAHEVGHEYFCQYSVYTRSLLNRVTVEGHEEDLLKHIKSLLSLLELHCDAFAAVALGALGYTPLEFIRGLERTAQEYSNYPTDNHPSVIQRRKLVENIVPPFVLETRPRQTPSFSRLKASIQSLHR